MDTLSVSSKHPFSLGSIEKALSALWRVDNSGATLGIHGERSRAYINLEQHSADETEYTLLLDYTEVDLAKRIIVQFADDHSLLIDNDCGTVLPGNEYVARIKENPEWDWRKAPDFPGFLQ